MKNHAIVAVFTAAIVLGITDSAMAQFGRGGGPPLSPEKQDAAWGVQAESVANALKLSDEGGTKLTEAYKAARTSRSKAFQELRESGEPGPGMFQEMQSLNNSERSKLREGLSDVLSGEQLNTAMASLGTFNNQWDRMIDVLSAYGLSGDSRNKALSLITQYVVDSDKARAEAMAAMDFQSMRQTMQSLKETLDTGMKDVLSAEHLRDWKTNTARRGRGGPGGSRRRPPR